MVDFQIHEKAQILFNEKKYTYQRVCEIKDAYKSALMGIQSAAVIMERSPELLILLFALLESGIPFMPVDSNMPQERVNYMLEDSKVDVVLTNARYSDRFQHPCIKVLEDLPKSGHTVVPNQDDNHTAYILYTSGSTGFPKGVEIPRSALKNFSDGIAKVIDFHPGKRIGCLTTISFDIFFLESIVALCEGLTIILAGEEVQGNPRLLARLIEEEKVDMLQMTPSMMQLIINHEPSLHCLKSVKEIMLGGEVLPLDMLRRLQKNTNARIYNMYGPTETTIWSSVAELTQSEMIHIGFPIQHTDLFILDEQNHLVRDGGIGEIAIGGAGLAKGYKNNKKLTEEKFIIQPQTGERVYLTGDFGKRLPNLAFQYIGRKDNQIKLRGHRVELEDIDFALSSVKGVQQAVITVANRNNTNILTAFYTSKEYLDSSQLYSELVKRVPDYMIPAQFIRVEEFSLTANGKIDRNRLLSDYEAKINEKKMDGKPEDSGVAESVIHLLYDMGVLDGVKITPETTLETIGIDSISFIKLVVKIEETFGFEFDDEMLLIRVFSNVQTMIDYVEKKMNDANIHA